MTAFYMFRLLFLTFFGKSRVDQEVEHHIHESPQSMLIPLVILAVLSVVGGWVGIGHRFEHFLAPSVTLQPHVVKPYVGPPGERETGREKIVETAEETTPAAPSEDLILMVLSVAIALSGIGLAWHLYLKRTELPDQIAKKFHGLYELVFHKYYVDELYDAMFVNRAKDLGLALGAFDSTIVDGLGVNGTGFATRVISQISIWWDTWIVDGSVRLGARIVWLFSYPVRMIQDGLVQSYMLLIVLGLIGFLAYYIHLSHHAVR
jgi:NADH-quinone oxidoreductase subunit L